MTTQHVDAAVMLTVESVSVDLRRAVSSVSSGEIPRATSRSSHRLNRNHLTPTVG
jgi:hypothetical protein